MSSSVPVPDPSDPAAALAPVVALRRLAEQLEFAAVEEAITQGWSWTDVHRGARGHAPGRPQAARPPDTIGNRDEVTMRRRLTDVRSMKQLFALAETEARGMPSVAALDLSTDSASSTHGV